MVISSRELWLLLPPPVETSSCSQISSQLSNLIDKTDAKCVLQWKRLQHRNLINYPSVFHQMISPNSAVPERAPFAVVMYVRVCVCVCVQVCIFGFWLFLWTCVCVHANVGASARVLSTLHVFNAIKTWSVCFLSDLDPSSEINVSFL